jgi:hypothetical protein
MNLKFLGILLCACFTLASCSKEDLQARAKNALDGTPNGQASPTTPQNDNAPLVINGTPSNGTEDTEAIITLSYTDSNSDLATACSASSLSNVTISTPCSCNGSGVCTIGVTGTSGYFGAASFDYTVTANSVTSNTASISYTIDTSAISCPTGFVAVDGNGTLGTTDFCVMKYEAKNDGGGNAVSQAAGNPWVSIKADDGVASNDTDAFEKCANMTEGGFSGTFALISNPEWMTIARDIETVGTNWSGGTTGSGNLARGWSARTTDDGFQNTAVAPTTDGTCIFNSAANTCAATGTHKLRRTHQLSNGSEIWDLSGNAWEWVDWDSTSAGFTTGPTDGDTGGWNELNDLVGSLTVDDVAPLGPYTSAEQAGRLFPYTSGGAALRGGYWNHGANAGAFTLNLYYDPSFLFAGASFGFRCSYRP